MSFNPFRVDPIHVRTTTPRTYEGTSLGSAMDYVGQLAQSSQFKTTLYFADGFTNEPGSDVNAWLNSCGVFGDIGDTNSLKYDLLCHSATIPGAKFELSTEQGAYQGITETFARAREFPQLTLDFYVDSQYQVIRMFEEWMNFINPLYTTQGYADAGSTGGSTYSTPNLETNNYYRFRYPNTYKRSISVTKFERNYPLTTSDSLAPKLDPGAPAIRSGMLTYNFINAFPIQVISIPLSYANSEIMKVSVVFNYDRYVTMKHESDRSPTAIKWRNFGTTTESTTATQPPVPINTAPSGQAGGPMASDIRLKENITKVGQSPSGINIYQWNYIGQTEVFEGVMAQELMRDRPDAVVLMNNGYLGVNYDLIDVSMREIWRSEKHL